MPITYPYHKVVAGRALEVISSAILLTIFSKRNGPVGDIKKILLVEPFQMGDVLSLTPLLSPLRRHYPNAKIFCLTKPASGAILKGDTRVNRVLGIDVPWADHGKKRFSLGRTLRVLVFAFRLRKERFDLSIDTRGDIRSQILMVLSGSRVRLGYTSYLHSNVRLRGYLLTHPVSESKLLHRYELNLDLLSRLGFKTSELFPIPFPTLHVDQSTNENQNSNVVVHVGGGWSYKRWEPAKWALLVDQLRSRFDWVFVIGGPGEREILDEVKKLLKVSDRISFKSTSLDELVELVHRCDQFIGLDSGPMNLAVCLNRPTIGLFGPGDSTMWRPLHPQGRHIHKGHRFPCNPCLQLRCVFPGKSCMQEIEVDEVLRLLD